MFLSRIKERIRYFIAHRFVKDFAVLQVGNIVGNITQAVIGIVFARVLQPEYYGIYALAFSLAGILSIFLGIGAQDAVTTILGRAYSQKNQEQIEEALAFLAKITMITGVLALFGSICGPILAHFLYHNYLIGVYAGIVVIASVISTTFFSFSTVILQVVGRIKSMMAIGLLDQLLRTTLALVFVLFGFKVLGIVLGHLTGAIIVMIVSATMWIRAHRDFSLVPSIQSVLAHSRHVSIRKYFSFSFWIAVDRNLSNLYNILPVFLLGIYVAPGQVTYFKLAFGYLNLALSFLGPISTLLNVEFPKLQVASHERLMRNFIRVSLYAMILSGCITAVVLAISPIVFKILYGSQYLASIPYVYGLFFYGLTMGLGIGLGSMVRALDKVMFSIKLHSVSLILGIPTALYLIKHFGGWGSVMIVTAWYASIHIIAFLYIVKILKKRDYNIAI